MLYPRNTCCKLGQNSTLISHMGGIICCRPVGAWHEVGLQSLPREPEPSPTRREHPGGIITTVSHSHPYGSHQVAQFGMPTSLGSESWFLAPCGYATSEGTKCWLTYLSSPRTPRWRLSSKPGTLPTVPCVLAL